MTHPKKSKTTGASYEAMSKAAVEVLKRRGAWFEGPVARSLRLRWERKKVKT